MSNKYDIVIIGGGNGGLMAACRASSMGMKTLLIDKHNMVGILVVLIIPLGKWGRKLAKNADPTTMKFTLLNCLPVSVVSAIIVSAAAAFFGVFMGMSRSGAPFQAIIGNWLAACLTEIPAAVADRQLRSRRYHLPDGRTDGRYTQGCRRACQGAG